MNVEYFVGHVTQQYIYNAISYEIERFGVEYLTFERVGLGYLVQAPFCPNCIFVIFFRHISSAHWTLVKIFFVQICLKYILCSITHPPKKFNGLPLIELQTSFNPLKSGAFRYEMQGRPGSVFRQVLAFCPFQVFLLVHAIFRHTDLFQCGDILRRVPPAGFLNELTAIITLILFSDHVIFCEPVLNGSPCRILCDIFIYPLHVTIHNMRIFVLLVLRNFLPEEVNFWMVHFLDNHDSLWRCHCLFLVSWT